MQGSAAELDFMMQDAGLPVVFSRGATTLATTFGLFDKKQILGQADGSYEVTGRDVTVTIRDGTQSTTTFEDTATIGGIAYSVRDLGLALADGTRVITLAGG